MNNAKPIWNKNNLKGYNIMSIVCECCGKESKKASKLSFSHKHHIYRQLPNLQSIKAVVNGRVKRIKVCTSCIKAGKVQKAV